MRIIKKSQYSIRYKIALYSVIFLLLPVCIMISILYESIYTDFYKSEMQKNDTLVRQTGNSMERIFDDVKTASNMLLTDEGIRAQMLSAKKAASYSAQMTMEHQFFSLQTSMLSHYLNCILAVTDRYGNCYSNMSDELINDTVVKRILAQPGKAANAVSGLRWHSREYHFPDLNPGSYLVFSRNYFDYTNAAFLGDIVICLRDDELLKVMSGVELGENNVCSLVAPDSYVLVSTSPGLGHSRYDFQGDTGHIVNYCRLSNGWYLVNQTDARQLHQMVNEKMRLLVFTILVIICSFIAFLVMFSSKIVAPILLLSNAAKEVSDGNLSVRTEIRGNDEIHNLSVAFNNMVVNLRQLMNDITENAKREKNLEIQMLYAQINPHFLFNTLNSIRWSADASGAPNVSRLIVALATILHGTLINKNEYIPLREEIDNVKNYIYIQKFRYPGRFEIEYGIDPELLDDLTPKFLVQPLIENSILHGFDGMEQAGKIYLRIYPQDGEDVFEVEDNGKGIPEDVKRRLLQEEAGESEERLNHIGVPNVNQRLILKYGDRSALSIRNLPQGGTLIRFVIPAQRSEPKDV